jgi:adenylosuccinate lyase
MSLEYENPLIKRYASKEMSFLFSPQNKFQTWRKLWIILAEAEKELGLPISEEQLEELRKYATDINFAEAEAQEKKVRHDVMSHVHAYGLQCPKAAGIIHLGATSCYVGDNTDLIQMKDALNLVKNRLLLTIDKLRWFAMEYRDMPTLGFTHYQAAQLSTVGKRACLWIQEMMLDFEELEFVINGLPFRGVKGTTGTQASFLELFDNDHEKVKSLDKMVTDKAGFSRKLTITGQTYTRKLDARIIAVLSSISQTLSKFSTDIRLLQNLKEIEEPFEKSQIGSSAMAYKRNPMRSERIGSLSRFVQSLGTSVSFTASTQWFERTLDDSANKRLVIPQAFLAVDAMLILAANVSDGMVVYPDMILRRVISELPILATENILMACVKKGGNRQELHEAIRVHSMEAGKRVKMDGKENDLIQRIAKDKLFGMNLEEIEKIMEPIKFIGRSIQLTEEFISQEVDPVLNAQTGWNNLDKEELNV